jgi:predicted GH43/DUF377 family glycosyl hydrolase
MHSKATRYDKNPILRPTENNWENKYVFNCAAVCTDEDNIIKILYRAVGDDGISRIGLAESDDGINITKRYDEPVLFPENELEVLGVEDPRITKIDDNYYITYVAASLEPSCNKKSPYEEGACWRTRTCLASTKDFKTFIKMGCILPDMNNKDVVLFPEKINGQYYMLHRIFPDIWLASSDDLMNWSNHRIVLKTGKNDAWDCNRIGAGAPPIKTKDGWLNIYHGVNDKMIYSLGIFLLDLENPDKVLYRSEEPILTPTEQYEINGWIPNVVFTCGVVPKEDNYIIYYGGADQVIGIAHYPKEN